MKSNVSQQTGGCRRSWKKRQRPGKLGASGKDIGNGGLGNRTDTEKRKKNLSGPWKGGNVLLRGRAARPVFGRSTGIKGIWPFPLFKRK